MRFTSPPPIEIAKLPELEYLAIKNGLFSKILPPDRNLDSLDGAYLGTYDYLREAAVKIGETALKERVKSSLTIVDIRSGQYDPRTTPLNVAFHFDIHPDDHSKACGSYAVSTHKAGSAVVGEIGLIFPVQNFVSMQDEVAKSHEAFFDFSEAEEFPLEQSVLYYFPPFCIHNSPQELGPYGRNFFRFKDLEDC